MLEQVILVDSDDNPIGLMEKMEAHRKAKLHRAFKDVLCISTTVVGFGRTRAVLILGTVKLWKKPPQED